MQREKTIQFWDNYHDENDSEEWISKPGEELLKMIFDQIYDERKENEDYSNFRCKTRCFSILEIGCGTSTLVRDLQRYIEERHPMIKVNACGTDVSKVCIDVSIKRDCLRTHPAFVTTDDSEVKIVSNAISSTSNPRGSLWYEVLNVLEGEPSRKNWDLIIDKGCLDTLLFRSRQRGTFNKNYPECLRILLDNLHGWQSTAAILARAAAGDDDLCAAPLVITDDNDLNDDYERTNKQLQQQGGTTSVYICITPRTKLKAVRDYAGFSSVSRYPLPKICRSKLEGRKNNDSNEKEKEIEHCDNDNGESPDVCNNKDSLGYMFVCPKNDDYQVGVSIPFPTFSSRHNNNNNNNPPKDENKCTGCKKTFQEFRKGEGLEFRGVTYWTRKWKAHCIHCKHE